MIRLKRSKKIRLIPRQYVTQTPIGFKFIAVILCTLIFIFGFCLGHINIDTSSGSEKFKLVFSIAFPLLITALFILFTNDYVEVRIENNKIEYEKKRNLELNIDNFYLEQELELLSALFRESGKLPNEDFDYKVFCAYIRNLHDNPIKFEDKLRGYIEELDGREQALKSLEEGFTKDKNNFSPLSRLVGEACNYALNLQLLDHHYPWVEPFYLDIRKYLKIWLSCSIKHRVPINVELIFQKDLGEEGEGRYYGKETYIKAIKYIKDEAFEDQEIHISFSTPMSRRIVKKYLNDLINIIENRFISNKSVKGI